MDPLDILPEEMWKILLNQLTICDDLLSAHNTCQLWRSLLNKNQHEWMFQGVLPHLAKYLPISDILSCRHVSKSWKKTVDSHLETGQQCISVIENPLQAIIIKPPRTLEVDLNGSAQRRKITPTEALKLFQTEFTAGEKGPTAKNPFVSRSLRLCIQERSSWSAFLEFLEKFGVHLHTLDLHLPIGRPDQEERTPPIETVKFIWNVLRHVPNLKKLVFITTCPIFIFAVGSAETQEEKMEIEQFLKNNSAPPLPQLKNLHFKGNIHMIEQVLEKAYTPQLSKYVYLSRNGAAPRKIPNLQELSWRFLDGCGIDEVNKLKNLKCPSLKRLDIFATCFEERYHGRNTAKLIFKALKTFQSSLTHLNLFWRSAPPRYPAQLKLPLLQELCLVSEGIQDSKTLNLSFLGNLTSLRKLKLCFLMPIYVSVSLLWSMERFRAQAKVNLGLYLNDWESGGPYYSNIWDFLPSLDVIECLVVDFPMVHGRKSVYTRAGWNRMQNLDMPSVALQNFSNLMI